MHENTVKRSIFKTNLLMTLITLFLIIIINIGTIYIYTETIEHDFENSINEVVDNEDLKDLMKKYTVSRKSFYLLFLADGILCILVFIGVNYVFSLRLVDHVMEPIHELSLGALRINNNDLTMPIEYIGDLEFEDVCDTFNLMQQHILDEREKNEKYEQARTQMITGISHDLRTPLTAIQGSIKALLDNVIKDDQQRQQFLSLAYNRIHDMNKLLDQLFYLSKLETGNMPVYLESVDLEKFISEYAQNKPIEVKSGIRNGINAMIDPEQVLRILDNLYENSRKYANVDELKIKITLIETEKYLSVCFHDNGKGVNEEQLPYLFDEFYRCDASRNQKDGSGIGLYIVKYLVEAMHGYVEAKNESGLSIYMYFVTGEAYGKENIDH